LHVLGFFDFVWLTPVCITALLAKTPLVLAILIKYCLCLKASKWSQEVAKRQLKMQNHPNSKLGPIFASVKGFNFQTLVLCSYLISITMCLPRFHPCHLIFPFSPLPTPLSFETIYWLN
jgi:hypothetical protein